MTSSKPIYIFQTASFRCGCVYRTVTDTMIFCPEHRHSWHRGATTASGY